MQQTPNTNHPAPEHRKMAAIMFVDMMGYTALMQEDEGLAKLLRSRQKKTLETFIPEYHGMIIQYFGDDTLSMFDSAADAVCAGIDTQRLYITLSNGSQHQFLRHYKILKIK